MAVHNYIAERAKGFRVRVETGEGDEASSVVVQFVNGQYKTEDEAVASALDKALAMNKISRFCRKVDRAAAERMAAEFLAKQRRMGAVQGQVTAIAAKTAMQSEQETRDAELKAANVDPAQVEADTGMKLTEKVDNPRVASLGLSTSPAVKL